VCIMKSGESPFFFTMKSLNEITPIIEEKLRFMGFFLHDIRFFRAGKRGILRVFIDKPGGVTIDDCEQASNAISTILDVENFSDLPYTLEVSSPGIDRPLHSERDFKMVIGHFLRVTVKNSQDVPAEKEYIGKLTAFENGRVLLDVEEEQTIEIPLSEVVKARVDVRFK
jgi:ribosome maturation factor RimP